MSGAVARGIGLAILCAALLVACDTTPLEPGTPAPVPPSATPRASRGTTLGAPRPPGGTPAAATLPPPPTRAPGAAGAAPGAAAAGTPGPAAAAGGAAL